MTAFACLLSGTATAQMHPQPTGGDPRIQSVDYRPDQVVAVEVATGYQVTIELAPDETVQSAAVGDSAAWQVTANKAGNRLFIKPLQSNVTTNLTVFTDVRSYAFDLSDALGNTATPYTIRFRYAVPSSGGFTPVQMPQQQRLYRLSGARALQPAAIHDDNIHTFIEWAPDAPLPATYTIDDAGREVLANGNMRQGVYVVDGVASRLIFRIDKKNARADRAPLPREKKR
ncbi:TrbG/VirB9 family P-type conjugative transfer protein [Sphingomonas sp. PB2P12]|uniref:TrbG/VirB9 family P-type conjugative transfer protein n=1 Tax=Sphingomonas sandaracina TaxID=3096157 RepID=UPI002FCA639E